MNGGARERAADVSHDATPTTTHDGARERAAGHVLTRIAVSLDAAIEVLVEVVQAEDLETRDSLIVAAMSLLETAGAIADRAACACGQSRIKPADDWMHAPLVCDALKLLDGGA
jgi:hypothetical protein